MSDGPPRHLAVLCAPHRLDRSICVGPRKNSRPPSCILRWTSSYVHGRCQSLISAAGQTLRQNVAAGASCPIQACALRSPLVLSGGVRVIHTPHSCHMSVESWNGRCFAHTWCCICTEPVFIYCLCDIVLGENAVTEIIMHLRDSTSIVVPTLLHAPHVRFAARQLA